MDDFILTPELAHKNAKKILKEDFFWSPVEESGPFGNDSGSDAFYGFRQWRRINQKSSPLIYLRVLLKSWNYPNFNWYELDSKKIEDYISASTQDDELLTDKHVPELIEIIKDRVEKDGNEFDEETIKQMIFDSLNYIGEKFLISQDSAIIAVGFGQFVLEGKLDEDIKELTKTAIDRELLPILLERWDDDYRKTRIEQSPRWLINFPLRCVAFPTPTNNLKSPPCP